MLTPEDIKELRESLGANQDDLAKAMGVSFSTISRWENGLSLPTDEQEEQLVALKQLIENQTFAIDKKKLRKLLVMMGIGGVISTAIIAGFTINNPLGAAISAVLKKYANAGKLLDLFKKDKKT